MTRALTLAAALGLLATPGIAGGYTVVAGPMPQLGQHQEASNGFAPAPTPNVDLFAPRPPDTGQPQVGASLADKAQPLRPGDGYPPGSAYTSDIERHSRGNGTLAPKINVTVPLY